MPRLFYVGNGKPVGPEVLQAGCDKSGAMPVGIRLNHTHNTRVPVDCLPDCAVIVFYRVQVYFSPCSLQKITHDESLYSVTAEK
jgi:hypothetical protein